MFSIAREVDPPIERIVGGSSLPTHGSSEVVVVVTSLN